MIEALGRQMLGATPDNLLAIEDSARMAARFETVDEIAAAILVAAFSGQEAVSRVEYGNGTSLALPTAQRHRDLIDQTFDMAAQQARGAWWLPAEVGIKPGLLNLPALLLKGSRFPHNAARTQNGRFLLTHPPAFFMWAVLQDLVGLLLAPIELRGAQVGKKEAEVTQRAWRAIDLGYSKLGLDAASKLALLRDAPHWARLRLTEQLDAKREVIEYLAGQVNGLTVRRWRAVRVSELVARYYGKAKREAPTQRQVLTRPLEPVLAGHFGGDWLAFLDYIGENPSPSEQVTTVLPKGHLYVAGSARAREVAAAKGVPVEEVQRMLATFYGDASVQSPVERRISTMRRYWASFDSIHSRQAPEMPALWGLVDSGFGFGVAGSDDPYNVGIYRHLLPSDLLADIDQLWGTECLARWPDRVVGATHTHKNLADAFGPALSFWQECALTVWFVCEGPYSRTDLPGLEAYHGRDWNRSRRLATRLTNPSLLS